MADRPALKTGQEIEVTPEMIEAGVDRLLDYSINFDDPAEVIRQVLIACLSVPSACVAQRSA